MTGDKYAIALVLGLFALLAALMFLPIFVGVGVGAPWLALTAALVILAWWFWRRRKKQG